MKSTEKSVSVKEKVMRAVFTIAASFSVLALLTITVFLFANGLPFIFRHWDSFWGTEWNLYANPAEYGILPMIVATILVTLLSVAIGVSVGLMTAICLYRLFPKKLVTPVSHMVNLLAGIPSVIYGLFGMVIFVPFVRDYLSPNGVGAGILTASLVLSIMILPTVVSVSLDSLKAVPTGYYEGGLALGATKEQTTFRVLVPAAKNGIFAGVVLATGRALGETMAVVMVIGNSPDMPKSLFQSVRTLTANIALGAMELSEEHTEALIATGVVLFVFTLIINIVFNVIREGRREKKQTPRKDKKATTDTQTAGEGITDAKE